MKKFVISIVVIAVLAGEVMLLIRGSHGTWDVRRSFVLQLVAFYEAHLPEWKLPTRVHMIRLALQSRADSIHLCLCLDE